MSPERHRMDTVAKSQAHDHKLRAQKIGGGSQVFSLLELTSQISPATGQII